MSPPLDLATPIPCHRCGYDVRAQPADGACPECETPVELSRRMAPIPRRPAWRDSDPRWRRRMLAGVGVLLLVPLMEALRKSGWAWQVPVPTFFSVQGPQSLGNSFVPMVYEPLAFCIGVVLLFSRERHRQAGPLDWSRRWGVITSYLVMLLGIVQVAFITSLVMVGIGALFQSMPRAYQPRLTSLFVEAGAGYIHYGLQPSGLSLAALAGLSSTAILLACVPLFNALRSCGSQVWAAILLGLLALAAITQGGSAGMYMLGLLPRARAEEWLHERSFYFAPTLLVAGLADLGWSSFSRAFLVEVVKWLTCLVIATWLCIAQLRAAGTRRRLAAS